MTTLAELFWNTVTRAPYQPALELDSESYTYARLGRMAGKLAAEILNIESGSQVVGILAQKTEAAYVGVLACISAGKTYCPLAISFPSARMLDILQQAECNIVIGCKDHLAALDDLLNVAPDPLTVVMLDGNFTELQAKHPQHRIITSKTGHSFKYSGQAKTDKYAYLLFTSGSTGRPKGVPIRHSNAVTYVNNIRNLIPFAETDRFSQTFPLTFDLSIHDMFVCWSVGACLCPVPDKQMISPARFIQQNKLNVWFSVPSMATLMQKFRQLRADAFPEIRLSLFCGEPLQLDTAKAWQKACPNSRLFNVYGPTEATIAVSHYEWLKHSANKSRNGVVSVGQIFPNQSYLLDQNTDTEGELLLVGSQVTDQYLHNPEQSRTVFSQRNGQNCYRTGDLFTVDSDGDLYFLSRLDHQVKINGHRIELDEISSTIRALLDEPMTCTVIARKGGRDIIVTYIATEKTHHVYEVQQQAKGKLPSYMIPESIVMIREMPLNQNGKIDRKKLQDLAAG